MGIKEHVVDDYTLLADDESVGNVTVCPGGVVHVNLAHYSLKFLPDDFVKFSELLGKARLSLDQPPRSGTGKPRLHVVTPEASPDQSPEPKK